MTTVIIYNSGSTQKPFSVASTVAFEARKQDSDITVLDVENFTYVHQGLPPVWYARLFGHKVYPGAFQEYLRSINVGYRVLESPGSRRVEPELTEEIAAKLEDAIKSDLFTYFRTDRLEDHPILAPYTARQIRRLSKPLFGELVNYFRSQEVDTVYVPNGRVAHQRLALLAAHEAGCKLRFYEIGRAVPDSAYIGDYQVHDREKTQTQARTVSSKFSRKQKKAAANDWLSRRMMPSSQINIFSKAWANSQELGSSSDKRATGKNAVLFTSSADEFSSYGEKWATQSWSDQFEAFTTILVQLGRHDVRATLRIHPNLINKSPKYVKREIIEIQRLKSKFPHLSIIGPTEPINSYSLVLDSDYIFVGRSTLGLEASLLGKCVWTTTPARYDEVADVRKLHEASDAVKENLSLWDASPSGAEDFVSYWTSEDYPFVATDQKWCTWNISNPPQSMRVANLLIQNSAIQRFLLILWEVRLVINRFRVRKEFRSISGWPR